jgi:alkanesulfonate monooxygenase SsuD/methylene tetrahydromethanopterin reductase-like flavin-dependent oxidoreductase (luciferase family)
MLDVMSNGRLIVGLIRGVPQTYAAYNFDPNESRGRFDEAVQLIVKAWTDPTFFDWRSRYYDFPAVSIWPRPVQKPYPPWVFSANSLESAIIGAKYGAIIGAIHLYTRDSLERISASVSRTGDKRARTGGSLCRTAF